MIGRSERYGKPRFTYSVRLLHQSRQSKRLAGLHFHGSIDLANCEPGTSMSCSTMLASVVDFADSRPHLQADIAVAQHDRQEIDLRAERLELNAGRAQALRNQDGNSPPTLNCAGRPLTATRFGSARVLAHSTFLQGIEKTEECVAAVDDAELERSQIVDHAWAAFDVGVAVSAPRVTCATSEIKPLTLETAPTPLPEKCAQSTPRSRSLVRETSITFTLSRICCTPPTVMLLITFGA